MVESPAPHTGNSSSTDSSNGTDLKLSTPKLEKLVTINTPTPEGASANPYTAKPELEAGWKVITNSASWKTSSEMDIWLTKHGLVESGSDELTYLDLEYLDDTEIEELSSLLTTVPLRKFKKFIHK